MIIRFDSAASLLPVHLRQTVLSLDDDIKNNAEEFRLRAGKPLSIRLPDGDMTIIQHSQLTAQDISLTLETATRSSVHTAMENLRLGFIPLRDGHRLGVCGTAVVRDGTVVTIRNPSSLSIRIAKQMPGISDKVMPQILENGVFNNTLIISPPGCGKTTLLRDMVRRLSSGSANMRLRGMRVSLADERGEIAAQYDAVPQLDIGPRTDVLDGCPKSAALMMMLRSMSPEVVAVDEITSPEDISALHSAVGCGVRLLATAHAESIEDLRRRSLYRGLLDVFDYIVTIRAAAIGREYNVFRIGEAAIC